PLGAFPDSSESSRHPDTHSSVAPLLPAPVSDPCRTPFRAIPDTLPILPDTLPMVPQNCPTSARNTVRQKSEHCPTEIGISVRQPSEYAARPEMEEKGRKPPKSDHGGGPLPGRPPSVAGLADRNNPKLYLTKHMLTATLTIPEALQIIIYIDTMQ